MKDATNFIEAVLKLYSAVGPWWSFGIVALAIILPILVIYDQNRRRNAFYYEVINQKEEQIKRIANENREWRNYFWITMGLTEEQIMSIQKPSDAKPVTAPQSGRPPKEERGGQK